MLNSALLGQKIAEKHPVDGVYLFGSRSKNEDTETSDIDLGILYQTVLGDTLAAHMRTQDLKQCLESELNMYGQLDLVDLEIVPVALQFAAISGDVIVNNNNLRLHHFENKVMSRMELG
jgi:predicted nucleotidyltransferase